MLQEAWNAAGGPGCRRSMAALRWHLTRSFQKAPAWAELIKGCAQQFTTAFN